MLRLIAFFGLTLFFSCDKEKYYTCVCTYHSDSVGIFTLGKVEKEEAYLQCQNRQADTLISTCYMEVR